MRLLTGTAMGFIIATAAGYVVPTQALAQQQPAAESGRSDDGEIVVTARRREESLQDVPLSVTALSADDLEQANVSRMENLENIAPGLNISPTQHRSNTPGFAIRGQRQDAGFLTNDPSVGIYFADAVQARTFGLGQAMYDLQSVQVLRGPQGTLFGRNTTGGAILFQPRLPALGVTEGYLRARLGNFDRFDLQGALNLPMGDDSAVRIAFNRTTRDGYIHDVVQDIWGNAEDTIGGRLTWRYEPSSNFSNTLYIDHYEADQPGGSMTRLTAVNPGASTANTLLNVSGIFPNQQANYDFYEVGGNYPGLSEGENTGAVNVTEWRIANGLTLKNIAQVRHVEMTEITDLDGTEASVLHLYQDQEADQVSEELQLQGQTDRLNWVVGVFYFNEDGVVDTRTSAFGGTANPRFGYATNTSYSVYGQGDLTFAPHWTATLGARYTWDEREINQQLRSAATNACIFCSSLSADFEALTYTASLNWNPAEGRLFYLATRRGYRSGGFNSSGNNAAALGPFDPEFVTDYELGAKVDWALQGGGLLRTNLAVYHSIYEDIQRTSIRLVSGVPVTAIFNAAEATVDGAELEVSFQPTRDFEFIASTAYTNPEYQDFIEQTSGGPVDRSGNTFAYIPEWTYRVGARWTLPFLRSEGGEMVASADYYWRDDQYHAEFNDERNFQPAYGLLSARLTYYNAFNTGADIAIWGTNLTDEEYYTSAGDSYGSLGVVYRALGEPKMYGIEFSHDF